MSNICKVITGVAVILRKNNKILLFKRNIPNKIAFGSYALPGGTVENNESLKETACRESAEELGIEINKNDISIVHLLRFREKFDLSNNITTQILFLYFAEIAKWKGEPKILEPHKHSDLGWFEINELPENIFGLNKEALINIDKGINFSDFGWE